MGKFNNRILIDAEHAINLVPSLSPRTSDLKKMLEEKQLSGRVMFGHHDTLAYGRSGGGWQGQSPIHPAPVLDPSNEKSDIYEATGFYPKIFSWDIASDDPKILFNQNLINKIDINDLGEWIKKVDASGGINTICWHCHNPYLCENPDLSKDKRSPRYLKAEEKNITGQFPKAISKILDEEIVPSTGKINTVRETFLSWVDDLCRFFKSLKDDTGKLIPIIFRPFHELPKDGEFFWWHNDKDNFSKLWFELYKRIRLENEVNNVLFCFSINDFFLANSWKDDLNNEVEFNNFAIKFPKSEYYDIIGYDCYQRLYLESQFANRKVTNASKYFTKKPENFFDITKGKVKIYKYDKNGVDNNIYGDYNSGIGKGTDYGFLNRQKKLNSLYLMKFAYKNKKIVALTEIGADYMNFDEKWYSKILGEILATTYNLSNGSKVNFAYTTLWRNPNPLPTSLNPTGDDSEYYAPFNPSSSDIKNGDYTLEYNVNFSELFNKKNSNIVDPLKPNNEFLLEFLNR